MHVPHSGPVPSAVNHPPPVGKLDDFRFVGRLNGGVDQVPRFAVIVAAEHMHPGVQIYDRMQQLSASRLNSATRRNKFKIVELTDGRWMINSRWNGPGMRYVHISDDEGASWNSRPAEDLVDPGCNGSIIRLSSMAEDGSGRNRLLFANANSADSRENMTVRISYDEGETWSDGRTIYGGSSAYSSLTVLDNGDIGLMFEKDGYTENTFVRFTLAWLTDGKDSIDLSRN